MSSLLVFIPPETKTAEDPIIDHQDPPESLRMANSVAKIPEPTQRGNAQSGGFSDIGQLLPDDGPSGPRNTGSDHNLRILSG